MHLQLIHHQLHVIGDESIEGAKGVTLFSDTSLNKDGYAYAVDNAVDGNQNWEDLLGGGDKDSDDVNMNVTWSTPQVDDEISTVAPGEISPNDNDSRIIVIWRNFSRRYS